MSDITTEDTGGGPGAAIEIHAHHDAAGTMVRVYVGDVQTNQYYVAAGKEWRKGFPPQAVIREYFTEEE